MYNKEVYVRINLKWVWNILWRLNRRILIQRHWSGLSNNKVVMCVCVDSSQTMACRGLMYLLFPILERSSLLSSDYWEQLLRQERDADNSSTSTSPRLTALNSIYVISKRQLIRIYRNRKTSCWSDYCAQTRRMNEDVRHVTPCNRSYKLHRQGQRRIMEVMWTSDKSARLQIQRSRVRFRTLPYFLRSRWAWNGVHSASWG
jgi:hypothetical protein